MVSALQRVNIVWKLIRNDSGVILELLGIDLEPFSNQKMNIWNISVDTNSENEKKS